VTGSTASALRRAGFVSLALAATGAAHALTSDAVHLTPLAPVIWLNVFAAVFILGRVFARGRFTRWGPWRTATALTGSQVFAHVALGSVPWSLGLNDHHHTALTPTALLVHLAAALVLGLALRFGERVLERLARAVVAVLTIERRRRPAMRTVRVAVPADPPRPGRRGGDGVSSRGPPVITPA